MDLSIVNCLTDDIWRKFLCFSQPMIIVDISIWNQYTKYVEIHRQSLRTLVPDYFFLISQFVQYQVKLILTHCT